MNYPIKINGIAIMFDDINKFLRKGQKTNAIQFIISESNCSEIVAVEVVEDIMHMKKLQSTKIENNNESNNMKQKVVNNQNIPKCPKCGCTNIQVVRKKWSLLTGFATNKVERVCANCLHKF